MGGVWVTGGARSIENVFFGIASFADCAWIIQDLWNSIDLHDFGKGLVGGAPKGGARCIDIARNLFASERFFDFMSYARKKSSRIVSSMYCCTPKQETRKYYAWAFLFALQVTCLCTS